MTARYSRFQLNPNALVGLKKFLMKSKSGPLDPRSSISPLNGATYISGELMIRQTS